MAKTKGKTVEVWDVRVERTVIDIVTCAGCTEEQARADPYKYSVHEQEIDMTDYTVLSVRKSS